MDTDCNGVPGPLAHHEALRDQQWAGQEHQVRDLTALPCCLTLACALASSDHLVEGSLPGVERLRAIS